jgi:DNA repair ATPase RecN
MISDNTTDESLNSSKHSSIRPPILRNQSASNIKRSQSTPSITQRSKHYTRKTPTELQTNIVKESDKLYNEIMPIIKETGILIDKLGINDNKLKSHTSAVTRIFEKYTKNINEINEENQKMYKQLNINHTMIDKIPERFNQFVKTSKSYFNQVSSARKKKLTDNRWVVTDIEGGRSRKHKSRRHNKRRRSNRRKSRRLL